MAKKNTQEEKVRLALHALLFFGITMLIIGGIFGGRYISSHKNAEEASTPPVYTYTYPWQQSFYLDSYTNPCPYCLDGVGYADGYDDGYYDFHPDPFSSGNYYQDIHSWMDYCEGYIQGYADGAFDRRFEEESEEWLEAWCPEWCEAH